MFKINNISNDNHKVTEQKGMFKVLEHMADYSVSPMNAESEYFMSQMGVRRRQAIAELNGDKGLILQSGAMQWTVGDVQATTGVKGAGDFFGKIIKSAVTKESAIKPEYEGEGILLTEPTYKYLLIENVEDWEGGLVVEDGMFLASENTVKQEIQSRSNVSSAVAGNEGLFNLKMTGKGCLCIRE